MRKGFSLVELSIVLVILGLLVGGVLSGQSLIRASELRSVTADYQRYQTALRSFQDKYFAIPGDMGTATNFWGKLDATGYGNTCWFVDTNGTTATCNGNGTGFVDSQACPANCNGYDWAFMHEAYRLWQHLTNAGLIEGSYAGNGNGTSSLPAQPASKISNAAFFIYSVDTVTAAAPYAPYYWQGDYGLMAIYDAPGVVLGNTSSHPLKPEEAWNIDTKLDDGKPGLGLVRTYNGTAGVPSNPGCTNATSTASAGYYDLTNSSKACALLFRLGM